LVKNPPQLEGGIKFGKVPIQKRIKEVKSLKIPEKLRKPFSPKERKV